MVSRTPWSIETSRFKLDQPCADHVDDLHQIMSDPEVMRFTPWALHTQRADTTALIEKYVKEWQDLIRFTYVVTDTEADRCVGIAETAHHRAFHWRRKLSA
jgi:RimJ/RimL family protein N-acetyltransferase